MKQIPLIIDTDPGIDDAVAIALAVFNPRFDVRLLAMSALKRQRRTRSS